GRGLVGYVRFLLTIGSNPQNESYGSAVDMPTLHGLAYAILGLRVSPIELNIVVALLSILLLGLVAWRWNSLRGTSSLDLMFAAALAASLAAGSHMFTHDLSPLIVPMFLAAAHVSTPRFHFLGRIAIRIVLSILWAFPIYF